VRRALRLVRGAFWRTWGIAALATLLAGIANSMLSTPARIILQSSDSSLGPFIITAILEAVATMITMPFVAGVCTLLYIDRRMRSEALDLQLIRVAQADSAAAAS
jgi:hypothetical protein